MKSKKHFTRMVAMYLLSNLSRTIGFCRPWFGRKCFWLIHALIPVLIFWSGASAGLNMQDVSIDRARKIATFECQNMYGKYPEFDHIIYYDSNEKPAVYVFVFRKTDRFKLKDQLLDHIAAKDGEAQEAIEIIRRNVDGKRSDLLEARRKLRAAYNEMWLSDDFISIYVSATTSRATIPEEREGLPEAYTHRLVAERLYQEKYRKAPNRYKYYYFGPLGVYFRGSDSKTLLFNVYEHAHTLSSDILQSISYRMDPAERTQDELDHLNAQWSFFIDSLSVENWERQIRRIDDRRPRRDEENELAYVPDFHQMEFLNIMPRAGSCFVMAAGSALGYYDHPDEERRDDRYYWNLVDLAYHEEEDISPQGGFYEFPGYPIEDDAELAGGVDDMLLNIARSMGYFDGDPGVRPIDAGPGIESFINDNRYENRLDFDIDPDLFFACEYRTIRNSIDQGNPVILRTTRCAWGHDDNDGEDFEDGNHAVIIVGYNTEMGEGYAQGIYVYINGIGPAGPLRWDYRDLGGRMTWEFHPDGDAGDLLDEANLESPRDGAEVESGMVDFNWSDVDGATEYWIQISGEEDFDNPDGAYFFNFYSENSAYRHRFDVPGTYYWHVVARNDRDNWCHFTDIQSFRVVAGEPRIVEVGFCDIPGSAADVFVSGDYAYVAAGNAGLRVIDVSNPEEPDEVGFYEEDEEWGGPDEEIWDVQTWFARSVHVVGNYAHVLGEYHEFHEINQDTIMHVWEISSLSYRVIDVSNPDSPDAVCIWETNEHEAVVYNPTDLYVTGDYTYIVYDWDAEGILCILDVSNLERPRFVSSYVTPGDADPRGVYVIGNYAYVATSGAEDEGLRVINVSNPENPNQVGAYDAQDGAEGVAVMGNFAYVANLGAGLRVIDISDPEHPDGVGFCDTPGQARGVAVSGNFVYVADGEAGLRMIDITNPERPDEVASCDTPGRACGVAVSGNHAYVADGNSLRILDCFGGGEEPAPPDIDTNPDWLNFGEVQVNEHEDRNLRILNVGEGLLHIENIIVGGNAPDRDYFEVLGDDPFDINPGAGRNITVRFTPRSAGVFDDASLVINSNDPDEAHLIVEMWGRGLEHGDDPDIAVEPQWLNFGEVPVGGYRESNLRISNVGEGLLSIDRIDPGGGQPDRDYYHVLGETHFDVNPDASRNVTVRFEPESEGLFDNARLVIVSNDPDEDILMVEMWGRGVEQEDEPQIVVDPDHIEAALAPGESEERTVTISNEGDADLVFHTDLELIREPGRDNVRRQPRRVRLGNEEITPSNELQIAIKAGTALPKQLEEWNRNTTELDWIVDGPRRDRRGGPDNFGYRWIDSDEDDGPNFNWIDISRDGRRLDAEDDWNSGRIDLGWSFPWYGNNFSIIRICSNGWITFNPDCDMDDYDVRQPPTHVEPNNILLPNQFDLDPENGGAMYFWTNENDSAVVSWIDVPEFDADHNYNVRSTFQVILGNNGTVVYQYGPQRNCDGSISNVGFESPDGSDGLSIIYRQANRIYNNLAIRIWVEGEDEDIEWLSVEPTEGEIEPNNDLDLTVILNAEGLELGEYEANLHILSNDPDDRDVAVNILLTVSEEDDEPRIAIEPENLNFGEVAVFRHRDIIINIRNEGDADLTVSDITIEGRWFSCDFDEEQIIEPDDNYRISVTFAPEDVGMFEGSLTIFSNDPDNRELDVSLRGVSRDQGNRESIREVGFYDTPGTAMGVAMAGDLAYVADQNSLRVIDVSDPEN
ncbi:MAG: hypothetical protein DRI01_02885, partial [Chloroflexi bacterium]